MYVNCTMQTIWNTTINIYQQCCHIYKTSIYIIFEMSITCKTFYGYPSKLLGGRFVKAWLEVIQLLVIVYQYIFYITPLFSWLFDDWMRTVHFHNQLSYIEEEIYLLNLYGKSTMQHPEEPMVPILVHCVS